MGSVFLLACMIPWNSDELAASPYVTAFEIIGIPGAEHVMNAVVLTAVLSCLNSGLYTASRMLFVLAAREEAPIALLTVNGKGVPVRAILFSSVDRLPVRDRGYVSPDTVFEFLLNSSGAIILFVYLLICVSQFVLRRRTPEDQLTVKMWAFPVLTLLTIAGILAILVQMGLDDVTRSQLLLSLLAWGVILVAYVLNRASPRRRGARTSRPPDAVRPGAGAGQRDDERGGAGARAARRARARPGPGSTSRCPPTRSTPARPRSRGRCSCGRRPAAPPRSGSTGCSTACARTGLEATGELGDYRPLVALREAVAEVEPDLVIISTHARGESTWLRKDLVSTARSELSVPVRHVIPGRARRRRSLRCASPSSAVTARPDAPSAPRSPRAAHAPSRSAGPTGRTSPTRWPAAPRRT